MIHRDILRDFEKKNVIVKFDSKIYLYLNQ